MKYRTFRNIVLVVVFSCGGLLGMFGAIKCAGTLSPPPVAAPRASPARPPATGAPSAPLQPGPGMREIDRAALALLERPVEPKIKDGTRGRPYKINVYSDDGRRWNRLKVDLDRDERWDESWTIKPDGSIERRVPAEGSVYRLAGASWELVSSP